MLLLDQWHARQRAGRRFAWALEARITAYIVDNECFAMFSNPTRHAFILLQTVNKRVTCLSLWDSVRYRCSSPSILQCDHAILHFEENGCIAHDFLQHFNQFRRVAYLRSRVIIHRLAIIRTRRSIDSHGRPSPETTLSDALSRLITRLTWIKSMTQ